MKIPGITGILCALFLLTPMTVTAMETGGSVHFCEGETGADGPCMKVKVKNSAMVIVKKVTIKQETGDAGLCEALEKTHLANLAEEGSFDTTLDRNCKYKISFKTTDGCIGDKVGHFAKKNADNGKTQVRLEGACGTLKVRPWGPDQID